MKTIRIFLALAIFTICSCKPKPTMVVNDVLIDIVKLSSSGAITENLEVKDAFFLVLDEWIEEFFAVGGYDHRLKESMTTWQLFEDQGNYIIVGSVARSDTDTYGFVWVIKNDAGDMNTVFLQIGDSIEKGEEYPRHLIPYSSKN